jgi:hypothetical protein
MLRREFCRERLRGRMGGGGRFRGVVGKHGGSAMAHLHEKVGQRVGESAEIHGDEKGGDNTLASGHLVLIVSFRLRSNRLSR